MALSNKDKDEIFQLRLKAAIDSRTTACRVKITHVAYYGVLFEGYTHYRQIDAFVKSLAKEIYGLPLRRPKGEPGATLKFELDVLENSKLMFGMVKRTSAPIWRNPDASDPKTLDTEALYGTVLRVYFQEGDFLFVQHPDGYVGYMPQDALTRIGGDEYYAWKNQPYAITLKPLEAGGIIIPPGARLSWIGGKLALENGRGLKVSHDQVEVFDQADSQFAAAALERAEDFMAAPYLWGGKTHTGIDCSGFVQTLAMQEGLFLPRDASMQCHVGEIVGYLPNYADLLPGDIMFFMNKNAYIYHVGIYMGEEKYMHSAGKTGPTISSLYPDGENFMKRYGSSFVYARRIR